MKKAASRAEIKIQKGVLRKQLADGIVDREYLEKELVDSGQIWYGETEPLISYTSPKDKKAPEELAQYISNYQPEQPFICELSDVTLCGPSAVAFSDQGDLILESVGGSKEFLFSRYKEFLGDKPVRTLLKGTTSEQAEISSASYVFPLVPVYNRYYYHWILLYLPKLRMLQQYEANTGNDPVVLVEEDPPSFVMEFLSLLGYSSDRVIEWVGGKQRVESAVITNQRIHSTGLNTYEQSVKDYIWLRDRILSQVSTQKDSEEKIYISRQKANRGRKVANYKEVLEELEARGFESVVLESLPIREQIKIISKADTIVSPHGAGLVNMIFAEDPTVIELFPDNVIKPHFYMLADLMGFEYRSLVTDSVEWNNLQVDIETLREILDGRCD